jgi:hypothetical protein
MGGVKYGGDAEWQYVLHRFEQTLTPSEKSKLLVALSATTDVMTLNRSVKFSRFIRFSSLVVETGLLIASISFGSLPTRLIIGLIQLFSCICDNSASERNKTSFQQLIM